MSGHYQTPESKKEEFRHYLERSGVTDAITKVLVSLYEEKDRPINAIEYVRLNLGVDVQNNLISRSEETLKAENEELKQKIKELNALIKSSSRMNPVSTE